MAQPRLFAVPLPAGFDYRAEVLEAHEERALVGTLRDVPFQEFEFHGFLGRRRVLFYGWRYDFGGGGLQPAEPIPDFLLPLRERAAAFAALPPEQLQQVLLTEYQPGAPIGWHRDRPVFEKVVGVSLGSPAILRFRRRKPGGFDRASLAVEPSSAYLLTDEVRHQWEHSIAPGDRLRFSITFRTLSELGRRKAAEVP